MFLNPLKIPLVILLFFALFLSACNKDMLIVYTEYLTLESLASYYVETPDPALNNPPFGQRLIIQWSIPKECGECPDRYLILTVRFHDRTEDTKVIHIKKLSGFYMYCLNKEAYCSNRGILTYKVQLIEDECLLEEWKHQLWAELIQFEENPESEELDFNFDIEEEDAASLK